MSNEYLDWKRDFVLENLPAGWEYKPGEHHISEDRFVKGEFSLDITESFNFLYNGKKVGREEFLNDILDTIKDKLEDL